MTDTKQTTWILAYFYTLSLQVVIFGRSHHFASERGSALIRGLLSPGPGAPKTFPRHALWIGHVDHRLGSKGFGKSPCIISKLPKGYNTNSFQWSISGWCCGGVLPLCSHAAVIRHGVDLCSGRFSQKLGRKKWLHLMMPGNVLTGEAWIFLWGKMAVTFFIFLNLGNVVEVAASLLVQSDCSNAGALGSCWWPAEAREDVLDHVSCNNGRRNVPGASQAVRFLGHFSKQVQHGSGNWRLLCKACLQNPFMFCEKNSAVLLQDRKRGCFNKWWHAGLAAVS